MRRMIELAAAMLVACFFLAPAAEAQCGESCTTIVGVNGEIVGYGCVIDSDSNTTCSATSSRCSENSCFAAGMALILDSKGTALASAQLCSGRVREIRHVPVARTDTKTTGERVAHATRTIKVRALRS